MSVLIIVLSAFVSCNKYKNDLFRLDIDNAASLFIAPADSMSEQSLYKITVNGIVEEVSYLNKRGNQIEGFFIPEMLYTISNSNFFAAKLRNQHNETNTYLICRSNGVVYNINANIEEFGTHNRVGGYMNSDYFALDEDNNMYFKNQNNLFRGYFLF